MFIFDGNAAGAAGIADAGTGAGGLRGAFALPVEWKDGSFSGLCVKGGAEVSAEWKRQPGGEGSLKATTDNLFRLQSACGKGLHGAPEREKFAANLDGNRFASWHI